MQKPLISHGWLRALLFAAIYVVSTIAAGFIVVMLVFLFKLIQDNGTVTFTSVREVFGKMLWMVVCVNTLGAFASVWLARKFVDKQSFFSLGFAWKGFENHAYTGLFGAIAMLSTGTIILLLLKYLSFTDINFDGITLLNGAAMMAFVAFAEEIVFRGYLLNNLMQSMNKWVALAITAVVFAAMHLGNPGMGIFSFFEILIAGIMLGVNYIYTKNLWFGILLHFVWNFMQGPILGYEVSGVNLTPVLHQSLNGPTVLTGGSFGFEGSILSTLLNLIFIAVLVFVYEKQSVNANETEILEKA